jgi:hypothetical protein
MKDHLGDGGLLERPFSEQEVEKALFQMAPSKAPGVDGFNAGFFQTHWQLIKGCVVPAILGFLNGGELPVEVNKTLLVLIPKVTNPQDLSQSSQFLFAMFCINYAPKRWQTDCDGFLMMLYRKNKAPLCQCA